MKSRKQRTFADLTCIGTIEKVREKMRFGGLKENQIALSINKQFYVKNNFK